jgi:hypothetical protein
MIKLPVLTDYLRLPGTNQSISTGDRVKRNFLFILEKMFRRVLGNPILTCPI